MQKLRQQQKEEELQRRMQKYMEEQALGAVGSEIKTKYPPGSFIMFSGSRDKDEELKTVSCNWYDKVGGSKPYKHIVSKPPEWQNISKEEADKIIEMFDEHKVWVWVYH